MKETKTPASSLTQVPVKNTGGVTLAPPVIQAKLLVGHPDDPLEHEADRAAERVVSLWQGGGFAAPAGETPPPPAAPLIQRRAAGPDAGAIQASAEVTGQIQSAHGGGQPLPAALQPSLEAAFGMDFSGVRLHTDHRADALNRELQARAFTTGQDIFFRQGEYRPGTAEGVRLLGHELGHVGQQGDSFIQRELSEDEVAHIIGVVHGNQPIGQLRRDIIRNGVAVLEENIQDIQQIKTAFAETYNESLENFIRFRFWMYREIATGLLYGLHSTTNEVNLAKCLLARPANNSEALEILENNGTRSHRADFSSRYNRVFRTLGNGDLETQIKRVFNGRDRFKALISMKRPYTNADRVYLHSAATAGTDAEPLLRILENQWSRGPAVFEQFINEWDISLEDVIPGSRSLIRGFEGRIALKGLQTDASGNFTVQNQLTYNARSMMYTVLSELSGEAHRRAVAVFRGYLDYKDRAPMSVETDLSQPGFTPDEQLNLDTLDRQLRAATLGEGTNEELLNRTLAGIRRIYQARIQRLAGHPEAQANAQSEWDNRARKLRGNLAAELSGDDLNLSRYIISNDLTVADQIWLASQNRDDDLVASLVTTEWQRGRIESLIRAAGNSVPGFRPEFNIGRSVTNQSPEIIGQVWALIYDNASDAVRGAKWLWRTLRPVRNIVASNRALVQIYQFLAGANPNLRSATLDVFNNWERRRGESAPEIKFLQYMYEAQFGGLPDFGRLRDLLFPTFSPEESQVRAREDWWHTRSPLGDPLVQVVESITGKTESRTQDERMRLHGRLSRNVVSREEMIQIIGRGFTEAEWQQIDETILNRRASQTQSITPLTQQRARSIEDLTDEQLRAVVSMRTYADFQEGIARIRAFRTEITGYVTTAVTIVAEAAGGPLMGPIIGAVSSILTEQALNPTESDLFSGDHLRTLFVAATGSAAGGLIRGYAQMSERAAGLLEQRFVGNFIQEGFTEAARQSANIITRRYSNNEDFDNAIWRALSSVAGAGISAGLFARNSPEFSQLRERVLNQIRENVAGVVIEEGMNTASGDIGTLSVEDLLGRLPGRIAESILQGVVSGITVHRREQREARQRNAADISHVTPEAIRQRPVEPASIIDSQPERSFYTSDEPTLNEQPLILHGVESNPARPEDIRQGPVEPTPFVDSETRLRFNTSGELILNHQPLILEGIENNSSRPEDIRQGPAESTSIVDSDGGHRDIQWNPVVPNVPGQILLGPDGRALNAHTSYPNTTEAIQYALEDGTLVSDSRASTLGIRERFAPGASYLMTLDQFNDFVVGRSVLGRADGQFVMPSDHTDRLLANCRRSDGSIDTQFLEQQLGLPDNHFMNGNGIVRIDVTRTLELSPRLPSEFASGANDQFVYGGQTSGGTPEALINPIPVNQASCEVILDLSHSPISTAAVAVSTSTGESPSSPLTRSNPDFFREMEVGQRRFYQDEGGRNSSAARIGPNSYRLEAILADTSPIRGDYQEQVPIPEGLIMGKGGFARLHALGPILGAENPQAIFFGSWELNNELQLHGIETYLAQLGAPRDIGVTFFLTVTVTGEPSANYPGARFVRDIRYEIHAQRTGQTDRELVLRQEVYVEQPENPQSHIDINEPFRSHDLENYLTPISPSTTGSPIVSGSRRSRIEQDISRGDATIFRDMVFARIRRLRRIGTVQANAFAEYLENRLSELGSSRSMQIKRLTDSVKENIQDEIDDLGNQYPDLFS